MGPKTEMGKPSRRFAHVSYSVRDANVENTHVLLSFRTLSYCGAAVSDEYESGNEQTIETVFSLFVLSYPHTV